MKCSWFIKVKGVDNNTGEQVDEWGCSIAWLPHLMLETAAQTKRSGSVVESFKDEMVRANEKTMMALFSMVQNEEPQKNIKAITYEDNSNQ